MKPKCIFLLFFAFLLNCKTPTQTENTTSHLISLKFGQSKTIQPLHLRLGFQDVLSDSRCPLNVLCVWEGRADIRLWLVPSKSDTTYITASIFGYVDKDDTLRHVAVDTLGFRIALLQLDPYPVHGVDVQKQDYVALLEISKCE